MHQEFAYAAPDDCRLDLHLPQQAPTRGLVLWFHGGGLTGGDKRDNPDLCALLNQAGFAVASANYRLSPTVRYPTYLDDARAAAAWAKQYAHQNRLPWWVSGHSAGGYLAAMVGLDPASAGLAGAFPISGQMFTHHQIRADLGRPPMKPFIDEAAPCANVRADAPPFLCIAGAEDMPTRAEENLYFAALMCMEGHSQTDALIVPGRDHCTIVGSLLAPGDPVAEAILHFLAKTAPCSCS